MTSTLIGPLSGVWDVEQAFLSTIRTWIDAYLAAVEEDHGLQRKSIERPPSPESIHGGTAEAISWKQDELPAVIVVVKPDGEPEVSSSAGYIQAFEVQVFCVVMGDDGVVHVQPEDAAREQASLYGAAVMGMLQHGGNLLGVLPNLEWIKLVGVPECEVPEPDKRNQQMSVTTFTVWVAPVIVQQDGPTGLTPQESPGYTGVEEPFGERPVAKDGDVIVVGEPTGNPL